MRKANWIEMSYINRASKYPCYMVVYNKDGTISYFDKSSGEIFYKQYCTCVGNGVNTQCKLHG